MLYCPGHTVSFQEVPDEISLDLLIADCPHRCPGCHSPELWTKTGENLLHILPSLLHQYGDVITCVCFMGEGQDWDDLSEAVELAHDAGFKTCLYTGCDLAEVPAKMHLDYIKVGRYYNNLGGLDHPETNQRMYKVSLNCDYLNLGPDCWHYQILEDITPQFRKTY